MNVFSDTTSKTDLLNRQPFAKGIARSLFYAVSEDDNGFVFGLNGRWGAGKSTLMRFVVDELKTLHQQQKNDRYEIFEFNPWRVSGQDQLLWSFYKALRKKIGKEGNVIKKYAESFSEWLDSSKIGKVLGQIPNVGEIKEKVQQSIQYALGEGDLEDMKEKLDEALVSSKIRLYIIMDDLDRLTPDEITQVFQLVKLNANFRNTFFLLAYDREIIVNAIEQKFLDNGERYLAKIVQIDYSLPELSSEDLDSLFFSALKNFFIRLNIEYDTSELRLFWSKYGMKSYFRTLRDVYRYLNGLAFRLPDIYQEINITHFLVVEAIRVFDFKGFNTLYWANEHSLRTARNFADFSNESTLPNFITRRLVTRLQSNTPVVSKGGRELFNVNFFEQYFTLSISIQDIPTIKLKKFIHSPEFETLEEILESNQLLSLLNRLSGYGLGREYPKFGIDPIRVLINFFDARIRRDKYLYSSLVSKLIKVFVNSLRINSGNIKLINDLWQELLIKFDYPEYTRFIVLTGAILEIEKAKITFKWYKERIEAFRVHINNFIQKTLSQISFVDLYEQESCFSFFFFLCFAKADPENYCLFITEKFIHFEQQLWILEQIIVHEAEVEGGFYWDLFNAELLLPPLLAKHIYTEFNNLSLQDPTNRNIFFTEYQEKMIDFFLRDIKSKEFKLTKK